MTWRKRSQSGLTLIELLVAIGIAVILVGLAIPGFQSLFERNQAKTAANQLQLALLFARSEAIKLDSTVTVCPMSEASDEACGSHWQNGWIVFANPDQLPQIPLPHADYLIQSQRSEGDFQLVDVPSTQRIQFDANGFLSLSPAITLRFEPASCPGTQAAVLVIDLDGSVSMTQQSC